MSADVDSNEFDVAFSTGKSGKAGNMAVKKSHSWDFVKIISLPARVTAPRLLCALDDDTIVLGDSMAGTLFTVNLTSELSDKKELPGGARVMDCAVMADGSLVASEFPSGRISIYDRDDKCVRELKLPGNREEQSNVVSVGKSGLIVASPVRGNTNVVYFMDPKSDQPVRMGNVDADEIHGELHVSSSGLVVAKTGDNEFTILDEITGGVRSKMTRTEWNEARCGLDRENDTMYVCYIRDTDAKPAIAVVDEVGIDGGMIVRDMIEFKQLSRPVIAPMAMPNGLLVICNGKDLLVYKKIKTNSSFGGKAWIKV